MVADSSGLNRETGVVTPIQGQTYYSVDAEVTGDAYHQEAVRCPIQNT